MNTWIEWIQLFLGFNKTIQIRKICFNKRQEGQIIYLNHEMKLNSTSIHHHCFIQLGPMERWYERPMDTMHSASRVRLWMSGGGPLHMIFSCSLLTFFRLHWGVCCSLTCCSEEKRKHACIHRGRHFLPEAISHFILTIAPYIIISSGSTRDRKPQQCEGNWTQTNTHPFTLQPISHPFTKPIPWNISISVHPQPFLKCLIHSCKSSHP